MNDIWQAYGAVQCTPVLNRLQDGAEGEEGAVVSRVALPLRLRPHLHHDVPHLLVHLHPL